MGDESCSEIIREYRATKSKKKDELIWWVEVRCRCGEVFSKPRYKYNASTKKCRNCAMTKLFDVGTKAERLTFLYRLPKLKSDQCYKFACVCDCGNLTVVESRNFGVTKSCGCLVVEKVRQMRTTHGMSSTRVHSIWKGMIARSKDTKGSRAKDYALRGISVEESWMKFENFYKDMGDPPEGMSLDRINNNKGYSKENCRWATLSQQQSNRRQKNSTSGRIGVNWDKKTCSWKVRLRVNKVDIWLGRYEEYDEACRVIEESELKHLGYSRRDYCV